MTHPKAQRALLRLYPPGWRARYGAELEALLADGAGDGSRPWRTAADLAAGAVREHWRSLVAGPGRSRDKVGGSTLLVLWAWALFVVAGIGVQKLSEHWQELTPAGSRALPAGAFDGLTIAAGIGTALVLAGIAACLPGLVAFLRDGGWPSIRRPIVLATALTAATAAALIPLIAWAHRLTPKQRNGGDTLYSHAFLVVAFLLVASLGAWTSAAVSTARKLTLPPWLVRVEASIGAAVTLSMCAMTAATATWWGGLAHSAPWALSGAPSGSHAATAPAVLVAYTTAMLLATMLASLGTARALRSFRTP